MKVFLITTAGTISGFLFPWGLALFNVSSSFNQETSYETVMTCMFGSAIGFGLITYRVVSKKIRSP